MWGEDATRRDINDNIFKVIFVDQETKMSQQKTVFQQ